MQLRYSGRVYPTPGQQESLARAFGCARVVFNDGLRLRQHAREACGTYVSDGELSRRLITEAKATPERARLEYKAARYGRTFAGIDRFIPSTGVCPETGTRVRPD